MQNDQTQLAAQLEDLTKKYETLNNIFLNHIHQDNDQTKQIPTDAMPLVEEDEIKCNASLARHFYVTLTDDRTLMNPTNMRDGRRYVFEIIQDATGGRLLTLDTKFTFGNSISSITLSTGAGLRDFIGCIYRVQEDKLYIVGFEDGY